MLCLYIWYTADAALTCRSGCVVPTRHTNCLCMDNDLSYCPLWANSTHKDAGMRSLRLRMGLDATNALSWHCLHIVACTDCSNSAASATCRSTPDHPRVPRLTALRTA